MQLWLDGTPLPLDRCSYNLLLCLVGHAGQLVHKDELLRVGWPGRIVSENSLAKGIGRLRVALDDSDGTLVRAVHGYGYRLATDVQRVEMPAVQTPREIIVEPPQPQWPRRLWMAALAVVIMLLVGASVALLPASSRGDKPSTATGVAGISNPMPDGPVIGSIAVLPFVDLSAAQDQAHFSDGLADELLTSLSRLPELRVVARTTSFAYRGKQTDLPSIGRALNAETVLEGSVRTSDKRIRISVQLVKSADGYQIWSQTYDRPVTELFAMQDEITRAIVAALRIELLPEQVQGLMQHHTNNPEAYRQYLLARHIFQDDETAERRSLVAYRRAVKLDPHFVDAWIDLANLLSYSGLYADSADEALAGKREARRIHDRLIAQQPRRADLYMQRAEARYSQWWDWNGAEQDLEQAAQLGLRDDPDRLIKLARLLAATGRMPQALDATAQVIQRNPQPTAFTVRGYHLLASGRYAEAQAVLQQSVRLDPLDEHAHYYLGLIELLRQKPSVALEHFEDSAHVFRLTGAALAHHALGDTAASNRDLDVLIRRYGHLLPYQVAEVHAWRGERDQAFVWLQRSAKLRDASFMYLAFDPLLDNIRDDPRFAALLKQVGLQRLIKPKAVAGA